MSELLTVIISWNRPDLLRRTVDSVRVCSRHRLLIVDNASNQETTDLIRSITTDDERLLFPVNRGINRAVEVALERCTEPYIHVSDADMQYLEPFDTAIDALERGALCVSYLDSPEHRVVGSNRRVGRDWLLKHAERGAALFMPTQYLKSLLPLPNGHTEFDWWVCQNAPRSLRRLDQSVWVLPRVAWHLGWRVGQSTWNTGHEHQEFYYVSR